MKWLFSQGSFASKLPLSFELKLHRLVIASLQKDCFEVYALVPGLLREEVRKYGAIHVESLALNLFIDLK